MPRYYPFIIITFISLTQQFVSAADVAGKVLNALTQGPESGVLVTLMLNGKTQAQQMPTNKDGSYLFKDVTEGQHQLLFQKNTYQAIVSPTNITVAKAPVQPSPVYVGPRGYVSVRLVYDLLKIRMASGKVSFDEDLKLIKADFGLTFAEAVRKERRDGVEIQNARDEGIIVEERPAPKMEIRSVGSK